jgi:hypothetical protein
MKFECAVMIKGSRCEENEAGDVTYLGALTFCREHQQAFEGLVESGDLLQAVNATKLDRLFRRPDAAEASRVAMKDLRDKKASVYFIRCGGYVKIGASRSPSARLESIRTVGGVLAPFLLDLSGAEMIATEPGGFTREKALHARFKHLRHTGEWFSEAPDLTKYIDSLAKKARTSQKPQDIHVA